MAFLKIARPLSSLRHLAEQQSVQNTALRHFTSIPLVIESSSRGERAFDIYSRLLRERIIMLNGPIDDQLSSVTVASLIFLESEHPEKPVSMNADTGLECGGSSCPGVLT